MKKKVLAPLDGSGLAECALSHVKDLAKSGLIEEVTLLNVLQIEIPWADGYGEGFGERLDINAIREKSFAASRRYLSGLEASLAAEGIKVKTDAIEANGVASAITDYAQQKGMDLIVVATNGYTGLKKMLLGSVASGIVQQSNVPVYLIRPEACRL
jgi:nucleotide-binding universal stress UspA family protein